MQQIKIQSKLLITLAAAIFLVAPFGVMAVNDVTLNGIVNYSLNTLEAVPTIITAGSAGPTQQVTNLDVESNYIDVTLDNL